LVLSAKKENGRGHLLLINGGFGSERERLEQERDD
jgi:hypothetical protein